MPDPLNTLGFVSWGLLGSAEGEGTGETVYILDLGIDVELQEAEAEVALQELIAEVVVDTLEIAVELEEDLVGVEIKGGST